jgi:hypothetical protein
VLPWARYQRMWLLCFWRGFGKTRTGSETIRIWVKENATFN